ncbi:hypothetical protein FRC18_004211 [Serendipita sp. 400]|nr:hypothetical protein FRC18_004211 [Serendipita sp. 400]
MVVKDDVPLNSIPYIDRPTIRFSSNESVEMPFSGFPNDPFPPFAVNKLILGYICKDGQPVLPDGMKRHLYEDLNRGFDD